MKIVVLAGGLSPERNVSLSSGALIATTLSEQGHRVMLLDVYRGVIIPESGIDSLFLENKTFAAEIGEKEPDLDEVRRENGGQIELIGKNVLEVCRAADVVFVALHGAMGENGQLQATFDNYGIRHYTGTGFVGALLAMNKDISKKLFRYAGIPTADWITLSAGGEDAQRRIEEAVGIPCVIKPLSCGSSVGVAATSSVACAASVAGTNRRSTVSATYLASTSIRRVAASCVAVSAEKVPPPLPVAGALSWPGPPLPGAYTPEACPDGEKGAPPCQGTPASPQRIARAATNATAIAPAASRARFLLLGALPMLPPPRTRSADAPVKQPNALRYLARPYQPTPSAF